MVSPELSLQEQAQPNVFTALEPYFIGAGLPAQPPELMVSQLLTNIRFFATTSLFLHLIVVTSEGPCATPVAVKQMAYSRVWD